MYRQMLSRGEEEPQWTDEIHPKRKNYSGKNAEITKQNLATKIVIADSKSNNFENNEIT